MKSTFRIKDSKGIKTFSHNDFPLQIGDGPDADILVANLGKQVIAAHLCLQAEQLFINTLKTDVSVFHNDKALKDSACFSHGDRLQVGSTMIFCREDTDGFSLQVVGQDRADENLSTRLPATVPEERIIKPVPFQPGNSHTPSKLSPGLKRPLGILLGIIFVFLFFSAWFVFTAKQVKIQIDPKPDRVSIKGGIVTPRFGNNYLLRPGSYVLKAFKQGYHQVELPFTVEDEKNRELTILMEKLPGRLSITAYHAEQPSLAVEGAAVYIDDEEIGTTPLSDIEVKPGLRRLVIKAKSYEELRVQLNIEGMDISQPFTFSLVPGWAEVKILTLPRITRVSVNGTHRGETPLILKLAKGTYELELRAEGYKTWHTQLVVEANQPQVLDSIQLQPADGTLALQTEPSGANVMVDGAFAGNTPIDIPLLPDTDHLLHISKAGYEKIEQKVVVASSEIKKLHLELIPYTGVVNFKVAPSDAELSIDGALWGTVPERLRLTAVKQKLEIKKEGYEPYETEITPRPGFPQELNVTLEKKTLTSGTTQKIIKAFNGYSLTLIHSTSFTMGSSRREQGRKSNETLRNIVLKRPFYMGVSEVTNKEFREFLAGHDSGSFKGHSLNQDKQPVVQVTWEQAVLFCNWLSEKEKLPAVYKKQGEELTPQEPLPAGYRLPTEAEWEYCVRFGQNKAALVYPWGDTFPPPSKTLNIADLSARDLLPNYLDTYDDGYPVSAPSASFAPNDLGIHDLGGNVAEWCHDYYSIYSYSPDKRYQDPAGPQQGKHHVVRDSSWRHASISVLRSAYRYYSNDKRIDVGFRICRYAEFPSEKK
ncbi:MAG: PEGA domain-containing protein [Candidatus Brocadiaceae bacterium]|nr:PEGA domain-containing protein [Candidatus Brocadiaceae bacterium]